MPGKHCLLSYPPTAPLLLILYSSRLLTKHYVSQTQLPSLDNYTLGSLNRSSLPYGSGHWKYQVIGTTGSDENSSDFQIVEREKGRESLLRASPYTDTNPIIKGPTLMIIFIPISLPSIHLQISWHHGSELQNMDFGRTQLSSWQLATCESLICFQERWNKLTQLESGVHLLQLVTANGEGKLWKTNMASRNTARLAGLAALCYNDQKL